MNKKLNAFTLVELIVVITILAILGTIAFINLQGYSTGARDSKRISDINNIQKKISIEVTKGTPLSSLINTIKTNSGLTIDNNNGISIQGTANFQNLKEEGKNFKDPVSKGDYVLSYSVGGSGTGAYKFVQISTINEEVGQAVVKGNYYPLKTGDSPSITVNNKDYYVVDEGVDLPYDIILTGWRSLDPNCDIDDITIGTQIWAGCNSTLGNGFEYNIEQDCYDYTGNLTTGCNRPSNEKENVYNPTYGVNNLWGKLYTWTGSLGTYNDLNANNIIEANEQGDDGACGVGYHVPSRTEFDTLNNYIAAQNGGSINIGWSVQSGKDETNNIVKALKLPLAGVAYFNGSSFARRGQYGHFWTSTSYGINAYYRYLKWDDNLFRSIYTLKTNGYSVRCIKD
ncbi:MAG: FISUMP domain-containing protein [Candidatus Gracilibacteria bacterium]|nr:FISUMP domain-containing protein [Candidatus Gracilibacteria bacterium]